jgi:hypothetical protein
MDATVRSKTWRGVAASVCLAAMASGLASGPVNASALVGASPSPTSTLAGVHGLPIIEPANLAAEPNVILTNGDYAYVSYACGMGGCFPTWLVGANIRTGKVAWRFLLGAVDTVPAPQVVWTGDAYATVIYGGSGQELDVVSPNGQKLTQERLPLANYYYALYPCPEGFLLVNEGSNPAKTTVQRMSPQGRPLWTVELPEGHVFAVSTRELVLGTTGTALPPYTAEALSTDTGKVLWTRTVDLYAFGNEASTATYIAGSYLVQAADLTVQGQARRDVRVLSMNSGRQLWRDLLPILGDQSPLALTGTQGFACSDGSSPTAYCVGFSLGTGRRTGTYPMPWKGKNIAALAVGGGYLFAGVYGGKPVIEAEPLMGGRSVALTLSHPLNSHNNTFFVTAFTLGGHHAILVLGPKDIAVW